MPCLICKNEVVEGGVFCYFHNKWIAAEVEFCNTTYQVIERRNIYNEEKEWMGDIDTVVFEGSGRAAKNRYHQLWSELISDELIDADKIDMNNEDDFDDAVVRIYDRYNEAVVNYPVYDLKEKETE